ncbi:DNA damage-binding protein 2-like [Liolophura sinensis]|uniref:DNA damage-binding protein 2-like n=1 Tax=Liolophura sinensis TaxID=3198878 RepID=UPI00315917EE
MGKADKCQDKVLSARHSARKRKQANTSTGDENTDLNGNIPVKNVKRTTKQQQSSGLDGNNDTNVKLPPKASSKQTNKTSRKSKLKPQCEDTGCDETINVQGETSSKYSWTDDSGNKEIHDIRTFAPEFDLDFFKTRASEIKIRPSSHGGWDSVNFVHFLCNKQLGVRQPQKLQKAVSKPLVSMLSELQFYRMASPFDRRVTALDWHPTNSNVVVAGSKGGDIILWNIESANEDMFKHGIGPGGSVQALKFWPKNDKYLLTASIDGQVALQDVEGKKSSIISDTMDCMDYWYCSVDVSATRDVVLTGDNVGNTLLLTPKGKKIWSHRLHRSKVTHVEWSPREDWLFCTASCDQTVKFWDVRMIKGRESSLVDLKHTKPVNSAYFSLTDGCRLLTTDQKNEIRVYTAPSWTLETSIAHPHRFFQHITPIKAHWHPLQDLVVVGRYPDPNFQENDSRTIDIFDAPSGGLVCQLQDPSVTGLISLNRFNPQGDVLASAMGYNIIAWSRKEEVLKKQEILLAELKKKALSADRGLAVGGGRRGQGSSKSRSQTKQTKTKATETKSKSETKTKSKTKETKR